ncbi:hypothetical protein RRF57_009518 [Xylaria bambusicola]|uniref:Uncharacterized protein n=1 Tax=Xylaria bambusicola TaxID=326684 RepID=A0AAN7UTN7_9PEZI
MKDEIEMSFIPASRSEPTEKDTVPETDEPTGNEMSEPSMVGKEEALLSAAISTGETSSMSDGYSLIKTSSITEELELMVPSMTPSIGEDGMSEPSVIHEAETSSAPSVVAEGTSSMVEEQEF